MTLTENAQAGLQQIEDVFAIIDEHGRVDRLVDGQQDSSVKEGYWTHLWFVMSNLKSILNAIVEKVKDEDC